MDIKTSVTLDEDTANRIKESAKRNRRGWTAELVMLAKKQLDQTTVDASNGQATV